MRWDRLFQDLEDQLSSGWEAECAAEAGEEERLRLARLTLRDRFAALAADDVAALDLAGGERVSGVVAGLGADCVVIDRSPGAALVPFKAIQAIGMPRTAVRRSLAAAPPPSLLAQRITFGFVLRDVARRRASVRVRVVDGRQLAGTIDRAGADHLDLAVHDAGGARRADAVSAYRIVAFAAIAWIELESVPDVL